MAGIPIPNPIQLMLDKELSGISKYVNNIPTTNPGFPTALKLSKVLSDEGQILASKSLPPDIQSKVEEVKAAISSGYPKPGEYDTRPNLTGRAKENQDNYNRTVQKIKVNDTAKEVSKKDPNSLTNFTNDRLYTILPRSSEYNLKGTNYKGDAGRGKIAYLRLLTKRSASDIKSSSNGLKQQDLSDLLSESGYKKFFLTDVQVSYNEKTQITNTFGDGEVTYFFGRQPMIFNLSGLVFDAMGQDWFTKLVSLYSDHIRGTHLAKNYELIELVLPNMKLKGSILSLSTQQNSASDQNISFSMQFMAKQVIPTPILTGFDISELSNEVISFSAGKNGGNSKTGTAPMKAQQATIWGVGGYQSTPSIKSPTSAISSTIDKLESVTKETDAFIKSIFSPVYGILTTITKVVQESTGSVTKLLSTVTSPVSLLLKNITNVSNKVIAVSNLIESGISDIVGIPERMVADFQGTIKHLKNSAGVVSRLPEDISQIVQRSFKRGRFKSGSAMLSSGNKRVRPKAALLSSGNPYTPRTAYKI